MSLNKIEQKLIQQGYVTQIHNSINSLIIAIGDENGEPKIGTTSRIELENKNTFKYFYFLGQDPIVEEFNDEKTLIEFIKLKFPVTKNGN